MKYDIKDEESSVIKNLEEKRHLEEPLLRENPNRFVIFPIQYWDVWGFYKKAVESHWVVEEVDLAKDIDQWNGLIESERFFFARLLAISAADVITNGNLVESFAQEVQIPEARCFYGFQMAMENIHSEMYSKLVEAFIKDTNERDKVFDSVLQYEFIKKKASWIKQWITDKNTSFGERLVALAAIQGIYSSGSFATVFWLKKKGAMQGLTRSNELIYRDKGFNRDFVCLLFKHVANKPNKERINEIIMGAVEIEKAYLTVDLPCDMIGIECKLMQEYIQSVADGLSVGLGYDKIYKIQNPFGFVDKLSTHFTKKNTPNFQNIEASGSKEDATFSMDEAF